MSPSLTAHQQELQQARLRRNDTLTELLLSMQRGDGTARGEFYDLTLPIVTHYVSCRIADEALVDECVTAAYATAITKFDAETDIAEAWIIRAARQVVTKRLGYGFKIAAVANDPEQAPLLQAMESLKPASQECITLRCILGLDAEIVSAVTGIPFDGVNALVLRGVTAMHKLLNSTTA